MKEWWQNLSLRDKQMLSLGSFVVALFLLYEVIWSPFSGKIDTMRHQVQHNQELLAWMQTADQRIRVLEKNSQSKAAQVNGSVLSIVQSAVNKSPLAQHVTQLRQAENDSVQFNLQKVDFDQLIVLLTDLSNEYGLIVGQFTATPTGKPGEVTADVVVKAS